MHGLELQQRLIDEGLNVPLIFLSAHGDVPAAVHAMQQGAVTFLQKPFNSQDFLHSINRLVRLAREQLETRLEQQRVRQQLDRLSAREREVLDGLLAGKTSKTLGKDLGLSPKTIDVHRASVMRKLVVESSAELLQRMGVGRGG